MGRKAVKAKNIALAAGSEARPEATPAVSPVVIPEAPKIEPPISDEYFKNYIYQHESNNNPGAINASSGACGLGQALPCSKMPCNLADYACQDNYFTSYMQKRYGSWANAYQFWISNKWW